MSEWRRRHSLLKTWSSWLINEESDRVNSYYFGWLRKLFEDDNNHPNDDRVLGTFGIVTYRLLKGRADQKETQGAMSRIGLFYGSICQLLVSFAILGCGSMTILSSIAGILTATLGIVTSISSGRSYYKIFLMINLSFPPLLVAHVYRNYYHSRIIFNECFPVIVDYTIDSVECSSSEGIDKIALLLTCVLLMFTLLCTRCCAEYLNSSTLLNNYSSHGLLFIYLRGVAGRLRVGLTDIQRRESDYPQQQSGSESESDPMTLMERFCGWFPMKEEHTQNSVDNNGLMELFENRITDTPSSGAKSGPSSPTSPLLGGPRHESIAGRLPVHLESMVDVLFQEPVIKQPVSSLQVHVPVPQRSQFGKNPSTGSNASSPSTQFRGRSETEFMSIGCFRSPHEHQNTTWKEYQGMEGSCDQDDINNPPTPPADCDDKTTEATRRKRRAYQVSLGKKTQEYINYINAVSVEERTPDDPVTPPVSPPQSRRTFYKVACEWRQQLHRWDTTEGYVAPGGKSVKSKKKSKSTLAPPTVNFDKTSPEMPASSGKLPATGKTAAGAAAAKAAPTPTPARTPAKKLSEKRVCWAPTTATPVPVPFSNYPVSNVNTHGSPLQLLSVAVMSTHSHCTGMYELQGFPVNGFPMWKVCSYL